MGRVIPIQMGLGFRVELTHFNVWAMVKTMGLQSIMEKCDRKGFPEIRGTLWGVPVIRTKLLGIYLGVLHLWKLLLVFWRL